MELMDFYLLYKKIYCRVKHFFQGLKVLKYPISKAHSAKFIKSTWTTPQILKNSLKKQKPPGTMQPCMKSLSLTLMVNTKQSKLAPPFNVYAIAINAISKIGSVLR